MLGSDYRALGVVRSLGRHGIRVHVLASGDDRLASYSRYATAVTEWPHKEAARLELLERLGVESPGRWALFPSADESAEFVARNHERLSRVLTLTTPPWEVLRWAIDKRLTHELAERAGVESPWTMYPASRAALEGAEVAFPVILKPAIKPDANRFTAAKAWRVDNREELLRRYDEACSLLDPEAVMVQELIGGGGESQLSYAALAQSGRVLHSLVARRTRQYPPDFGRASTFVETIDDPGIGDASQRVIEAAQFSGLIEIEYKVDADTGRLLLLDINPRVWGWQSICARAGVDFPWLLWLALRGEDVSKTRARPGVRWVRISTDLPTAAREIMRRRMSLWRYVASLRPPVEGAIFAADDPKPGLVEVPLLLRTLMRRRATNDWV